MGRLPALPQRPAGTSRREFFKRTGAAAALAGAPLLARAAGAGPVFQHGVASGDPLADRVILWTRATPRTDRAALRVGWVVAADPGLASVVASGSFVTGAWRDYTVKVDATGLAPASTYYYAFDAEGERSPVGRTRTLPTGSVERLRIAIASCANLAYGWFNAYRRIAERAELDLVIHLGDYLYEYGNGTYGDARPVEPPTEIVTLTDYRTRHAQYKRDADLQEAHRQHPWAIIWDDHETANNAWQHGAENHDRATEGLWAVRVANALRAYDEWMPVRLGNGPAAALERAESRSFAFGDLAELMLLEERLSARAKQATARVAVPDVGAGFTQTGDFADPDRELIGPAQEAWLAAKLRGGRTRWKLVGQGVMFAQLKLVGAPLAQGGGIFLNPDQWDGYQPARDRVYAMIAGDATHPPVADVVWLTGDIHSSWAAELTPDPNNPDLASGGYDPVTGAGSKAVEFVATSITSPGLDDPEGKLATLVRSINPHFKFVDLDQHGYLLLDIDPTRIVCEWWFVDTVAAPSPMQSLGAAFEVQTGSAHLRPTVATEPPAIFPPPAP